MAAICLVSNGQAVRYSNGIQKLDYLTTEWLSIIQNPDLFSIQIPTVFWVYPLPVWLVDLAVQVQWMQLCWQSHCWPPPVPGYWPPRSRCSSGSWRCRCLEREIRTRWGVTQHNLWAGPCSRHSSVSFRWWQGSRAARCRRGSPPWAPWWLSL